MAETSESVRDTESRRKAARAIRMWAGVTLSSVVVLSALAIWHLIRRGRLLRSSLSPPKSLPRWEPPGIDLT